MTPPRPDGAPADRAAGLSDAKRSLLAQRLRGARAAVSDIISPRPVGAPARLSAGQERLWFLNQADPESAAYTMAQALRVRGPLDAGRLGAAVRTVVGRHEGLRSRVEAEGGRPRLRLADTAEIDWVEDAVGGDTEADRLDDARHRAEAVVRRPFDLASGPLVRVGVLRLGADDHVVVLALHHLVADEWSLEVFWREAAARYADPEAALDPLPIQAADVAHWQRSHADGGSSLAYWTRQLEGAVAVAPPPDCAARPSGATPGGLRSRALSDALEDRVRTAAAEAGVTRFVYLLASVQALLARTTGETDVAVGVPVTLRGRAETHPLIGFFLNTVVVRGDLSGDPPFRAVLAHTQERVLEALAHQEVPFGDVVDALHPRRRGGRTSLFRTMFVLQQEPPTPSLGEALDVEPLPVESGAAKFDLTLFATEAAGGLTLTAEYDRALYSEAAADRLLEQWETLLGGLADQTDLPVSAVPLVSATERAFLLDAADGGPAPTVPEGGVLRWIATCVARTPDAEAVVAPDGRLTYADLWERAGRLAARLRTLGVAADVPVGLCLERSTALLVGLVGVLRAGGAYVPLDPGYPAPRLGQMLDDASVPVLVTRARYLEALPASGLAVVDLDEDRSEAADPEAMDPEADAPTDLDRLAYVLYTSGSTGRPKGVEVSHRTLASSTAARREVYPEAVVRFLLLSSVAFDSSVAGLFWTLASGGALVLPPERAEQDMAALTALINRERVTHTLCLPSLHRVVLEHAPPGALASLRRVVVAGEPLPPALVPLHHARLPEVALVNEYGPTEATVWATVHEVAASEDRARVPVGRPIPGTRVYVVDDRGDLAPTGVFGELCIGGAGVARGYHGRPDQTAAAFGSDPFAGDPGARLYRTGDRARVLADGTLDVLGRLDDQVKIRGYRVELGEIETVLREHPDVADAAVVLQIPEAPALDDLDVLERRLRALGPETAGRLLDDLERS